MPMVGFIAGALFAGRALIATASYFIGIASVVVSGLILKKTKPFAGKPAPFVMELPAYHMPVASNIFRTTWERGWSFIKRAGSVILAASVIIWTLDNLSFDGGFHYITDLNGGKSILETLGGLLSWVFAPLGFGRWQSAVATILGLVAKEEIVGVFGSLGEDISIFFDGRLSGFSFLVFNLLCAPCFAAMGAIRREMNSAKWTFGAIGYMCVFAYAVSLMIYQIGSFIAHGQFGIWTIMAFSTALIMLYLIFRKNKSEKGDK